MHGAWSYRRSTSVILYVFYKNITLYLIEFWFAFLNGFSGQIIFERWMIASFNVLFTALLPFAMGMFDQHASAESLMNVPELYRSGPQRKHFNTKVFWTHIVNAIYHSLICFWLPVAAVGWGVVHSNGHVVGMWFTGCVIYAMVVYVVTLHGALMLHTWVSWSHVAVWGSLLVWIIFTFFYFNIWKTQSLGGVAFEVYGVDRQMYSSGVFWFISIMMPVFALFTDYVYKAFKVNFFKDIDDEIREKVGSGSVCLCVCHMTY